MAQERLTENDKKLISRLHEYANFRDYANAEELIALCDTEDAKCAINRFMIDWYHKEEALAGNI